MYTHMSNSLPLDVPIISSQYMRFLERYKMSVFGRIFSCTLSCWKVLSPSCFQVLGHSFVKHVTGVLGRKTNLLGTSEFTQVTM